MLIAHAPLICTAFFCSLPELIEKLHTDLLQDCYGNSKDNPDTDRD
jgi:hypothetical protein